MMEKYNTLGKICFACVFINIFLAILFALSGSLMSLASVLSAFCCHISLYSEKCKNKT